MEVNEFYKEKDNLLNLSLANVERFGDESHCEASSRFQFHFTGKIL